MSTNKNQTKKEKREGARLARMEAQKKRQRAKRRKQVLLYATVGVLLVLIAGYFVRSRVVSKAEAEAAGCTTIRRFEEMAAAPHLEPESELPEYNSSPPTSGLHFAQTAPWGAHDEKLDDRTVIHNMEHGGVIIRYRTTGAGALSEDEIDSLVDLVDSYPPENGGVIAEPDEDIDKPIAMTAWTRMQTCNEYREAAVRAFIRARCAKGPEQVPLACRG